VLATKAANLAKQDRLPTAVEARTWMQRNTAYEDALQSIADKTGLRWDPEGLKCLGGWLLAK